MRRLSSVLPSSLFLLTEMLLQSPFCLRTVGLNVSNTSLTKSFHLIVPSATESRRSSTSDVNPLLISESKCSRRYSRTFSPSSVINSLFFC